MGFAVANVWVERFNLQSRYVYQSKKKIFALQNYRDFFSNFTLVFELPFFFRINSFLPQKVKF